jgi:hypothetical protein
MKKPVKNSKSVYIGLRMPRELHERAIERAKRDMRSLGNYIKCLIYRDLDAPVADERPDGYGVDHDARADRTRARSSVSD